jgi:hypothetical protein
MLTRLAINQNKSRGAIPVANPACSVFKEQWPARKEVAEQYHRDRAGRVLIVETPPARLARRLMDPAISLECAWDEISRAARARYNEAPKATYDAVVYELRTYGLPQLSKPNCQQRIADLSIAQLKNLIACLQQRRSKYPNVSDELLTAVGEIYDARVMSNGQ